MIPLALHGHRREGKYFTPGEAADRLRLHPCTVYGLVKRGKVRAVRLGRRILIREGGRQEAGILKRSPPSSLRLAVPWGRRARRRVECPSRTIRMWVPWAEIAGGGEGGSVV
ncbi:MAG: helix-turn-helix domain-containing protein [Chloroflexi bacterium]|nr:helix-turn-helix domain-containing protein [Chloroflexota bacterium]